MKSMVFYNVKLDRTGVAQGHTPGVPCDCNIVVPVGPREWGGSVLVTPQDASWSAAVVKVYGGHSPTGPFFQAAFSQTLTSGATSASFSQIDTAYVAIVLTTANATPSLATISLALVDGQ